MIILLLPIIFIIFCIIMSIPVIKLTSPCFWGLHDNKFNGGSWVGGYFIESQKCKKCGKIS